MLHPAVFLMKAARDWSRDDLTVPLDRPMARRILVQRQVHWDLALVADVGGKDTAQIGLAKDDDMIEAFAVDRTDQSFRVPVLPG